MRIALIQHSAGVGPAAIQQWLGEHQASWHRVYAGEPLPSLEDFELLLLLDGSLSVHDERRHGWMAAEKCLIHQALMARKRVFGSGLGALLLAEALGARITVGPEAARIGWWQLEKDLQSRQSPLGRMLPHHLLALHWQRESCSLPPGAIALYGSAAAALQGFVWQERAIGLLCQLESDAESLDERLQQAAADLGLSGEVQERASIRDGAPHAASANATLFRLLDYLSGAHAHMT